MKIRKEDITQFFRFALVGVLNSLIDLGILNILIVIFGATPFRYVIWKTISFSVATINSYYLNKRFTFRASEASLVKEGRQFLVVTFISLCVNVLVPSAIFFLLVKAHVGTPSIDANIGAVIGIGLSTLSNFFGYKFFVFKKE